MKWKQAVKVLLITALLVMTTFHYVPLAMAKKQVTVGFLTPMYGSLSWLGIQTAFDEKADTIIIPELDRYKTNKDRQLLYVGMTRSRKRLILSATGFTDLIKSLEPYKS